MAEKIPAKLDADGQSLWLQCEWILGGGAVSPSAALQLQALNIRRELRLESSVASAESRLTEIATILDGAADIIGPREPTFRDLTADEVQRIYELAKGV